MIRAEARSVRSERVSAAARELIVMGAVYEKAEDRFGETKSGWWFDTVFLGSDPVDALRVAKGN
jgi:hypothetical protein